MKIGFDAKRAFLNNTGLGNYSRNTIRVLSKYYEENDYFLYTPKKSRNNRLGFLTKRENTFTRTPFSFMGNLFTSYWRSKDIIKDLQQDKINLYHGLSHELPIGIENSGIKSIVTIHDLIFLRYPALFSWIDRNIYLKKIKSSCKRANKIIAVSEQTKSDIMKFLKIPEKKITVVYQGCNIAFQSVISEKIKKQVCGTYNLPKEFLLSVGSIEQRKNLLTILKSLKELENKHLVIIGDGKKYKKKCQDFIQKNHLQTRVTFLSKLNVSEMAAIYQQADMLIYPSSFEGFGIPILEALFSKTPVITSKGSCFSETGGKDSIYINPLSHDELTQAILLIDNNKNVQETMREQGWIYAQNFVNKKIASNLMNVYTSI